MVLGIVVGMKFYNDKYNNINNNFQIVCISILIFSMGVSLGNRDNLFGELSTLGIKSIIIAVVSILFSVVIVYLLTKKFIGDKNDNNSNR